MACAACAVQEDLRQAHAAVKGACMSYQNEFPNSTKATKGYPLYTADEVSNWPTVEWIVDGVIQKGTAVVIYGESRIGKSFISLDLGSKMSSGDDWFGHAVKPVRVIYFAAESPQGVRNRIKAIEQHTGAKLPTNLRFMRDAVNIAGPDDIQRVIDTVRGTADVLIIDTFNAAASYSDENASKDMGVVLNGVRRIIDETGCTVIFVHHTGWSADDRPRGHSSLPAMMDTRILVKKDRGYPSWQVKGQREGEDTGAKRFSLQKVAINEGAESSCVVVPVAGGSAAKSFAEPRGENQRQVLLELQRLSKEHVQAPYPRDVLLDAAMSVFNADPKHKRGRATEAIDGLIQQGFLVGTSDGLVTLRG